MRSEVDQMLAWAVGRAGADTGIVPKEAVDEGRYAMNTSTRVGVVVDDFPVLSETFVIRQVAALIDAGHDVTVFARSRSTSGLGHPDAQRLQLANRGVYASRLASFRFADIVRRPYRVAQQLREVAVRSNLQDALQCQTLLCHFGPNGLRAARLRSAGFKGQLLTVFHGYDLSSYLMKHGERVYDPLFRTGDLFLPVSARFADRLAGLGCPQDRTRVLHMGVDCGAIKFIPRQGSPRVELVFVGRLVEKKGLAFGLDALSQVAHQRPDLDWHLTVLGDGPLSPELQALTLAKGLASRVTFTGPLPPPAALSKLSISDILLLPSVTARDRDQEGIPVSIMEAMASGAMVVSTKHSGIPELVTHGVSGMLAEERDLDGLATILAQAIEHPLMRREMAAKARVRVECEFNSEKLDRELLALIDRSGGAVAQDGSV